VTCQRLPRFFLILAVMLLPLFASGQTSVTGQWSAVQTWPNTNPGWVPTHVIMLPTGKVMYWSSYGDGLNPHFWDPATNAVTSAPLPGYNIFCAGHSALADGKLLVTGGHIDDYVGYAHASIYDPFANTWTQVPDMNAGRWYPTNTTLSNGDVLTVSGDINGPASSQNFNTTPQVYQRSSNSWRTLSSAVRQLQLYPFMFLAPNGKVFLAGWNPDTRYLDTSGTGTWTFLANSIHGWRNYGSAVMYAPGKVLYAGGGVDSVFSRDTTRTPTNAVEVIDLNQSSPAWRAVSSMAFARRQLNATIVADGSVLVTGGTSGTGFNNQGAAVHTAELWNPTTESWTTMASETHNRTYHSTAVLLPSGKVLSSGSGEGGGILFQNSEFSAQLFSPPYLFKADGSLAPRPSITSVPGRISYGKTFTIQTPTPASISRGTLIRLSSVTHGFNQSQRLFPLTVRATGSTTLSAVAPARGALAPPGPYMLFLINSAGVPSIAKIVMVGP